MKYTHVALSLLEMVIILHSPLSTLSSPLSPLPPLPSLLRPPSLLLSPLLSHRYSQWPHEGGEVSEMEEKILRKLAQTGIQQW